jgi:Calpain family cysteine protease
VNKEQPKEQASKKKQTSSSLALGKGPVSSKTKPSPPSPSRPARPPSIAATMEAKPPPSPTLLCPPSPLQLQKKKLKLHFSGASHQEKLANTYANAEADCWKLRELKFNGNGMFSKLGKKEEVKGKSIRKGIVHFTEHPETYVCMMYQTDMVTTRPHHKQRYTLLHRKGTRNYVPQGIDMARGVLTLLLYEYQRLPPFPDNLLPRAFRDQYTDSVLNKFRGRLLHDPARNNPPILPGRGMGVGDAPNLKIIGDVDPSDIHQGSIGNCWLLSAISSLAEFDGAVKHLFRKTKNLDEMPRCGPNLYTISLWDLKTGKEADVVVDERLCADMKGDLLSSKPSHDGELWVCYLEKAIVAHCGGWDAVVGGQCTHAWSILTGCQEQYNIYKDVVTGKFGCFARYNPSEKKWTRPTSNSPRDAASQPVWRAPWPKAVTAGSIRRNNKSLPAIGDLTHDELFHYMCAWDDADYIVGCSTKMVSHKEGSCQEGLVDFHAYSVLQAIHNVAGTDIDLIQVRNPWGMSEIENGMFDDDGPGWTKYPQIKKALNPVVADDGIFWVTKKEFFHFFHTIYVSASSMTKFLEG